MNRRLPLLILGYLLLAAPLHAEEGMQEKIRQLEQQIQELKTLRAQQAVGKQKKMVDTILETREKCVEKGFFK